MITDNHKNEAATLGAANKEGQISSIRMRHINRLLTEMRRNFSLRLLHISPQLSFVEQTIPALSQFCGLSLEEVEDYVDQFFTTRLWTLNENQQVVLSDNSILRLGQSSVDEHIGTSLGMMVHLDPHGPCWYDSLVISTTAELKRDYYKAIYKAMSDLVEKSKNVEPDCLFSWTHQGLDCTSGITGKQK